VAAALFDAAAAYLGQRGLRAMRGPTNPSINESSGLLVNGFDRAPSLLMPYNPPSYEQFLLRYGFERVMTMWAYYGAWKHLNTERLRRGAEVVRRRMPGLSLRNPDMSRFEEEALTMCGIYNRAFDHGWGNVPMSEAEFLYMAKAMRPILDPRLVFFLEHRGRTVGFSLSLPNINTVLGHLPDGRLLPFGFLKLLGHLRFTQCPEFRTVVLALLPEYQRRGLDSLLILNTIERGRQHGYLASELSWVMDDNVVLKNALANLGAVVDKEYAMFEKRIA
jgi:GNAT superfamily N-acetyltransferase